MKILHLGGSLKEAFISFPLKRVMKLSYVAEETFGFFLQPRDKGDFAAHRSKYVGFWNIVAVAIVMGDKRREEWADLTTR